MILLGKRAESGVSIAAICKMRTIAVGMVLDPYLPAIILPYLQICCILTPRAVGAICPSVNSQWRSVCNN